MHMTQTAKYSYKELTFVTRTRDVLYARTHTKTNTHFYPATQWHTTSHTPQLVPSEATPVTRVHSYRFITPPLLKLFHSYPVLYHPACSLWPMNSHSSPSNLMQLDWSPILGSGTHVQRLHTHNAYVHAHTHTHRKIKGNEIGDGSA